MVFNFKRRYVGLQEKMEELDLDLVVYGSCQNFQYLTGLQIDWRRSVDLGSQANLVFVPKRGMPILTVAEEWETSAGKSWIKNVRIFNEKEGLARLMQGVMSDICIRGNRVGIGDHLWGSALLELKRVLRNPAFVSAEGLMDDIRMIKDAGEIEKLRKVATLTDEAVDAVLPEIKRNVTQRELRVELEYEGRRLGASDVSFPPWIGFVKSGSGVSSELAIVPSDEGLKTGTSIAFDNGFVFDGYCSDFGRSFYYGSPRRDFKKGYEALQHAVVETVDKMKEGSMRVCDVFPLIEKSLDASGYGDYLRARLPMKSVGHNIGVEVHEPPWLDPNYKNLLKSNMVMAIEPKLWRSGEYYFRVEDIVLVGKKKTEFLTKFDRDIFQL